MKVIEYSKPKLPRVKMVCDEIIDPKLTEHEAIECCFSKSSTTLVAGGTGSGKTTWVVQMMKSIFKKVFHDVILVMPRNSFESINPKDNPFLKIDPDNIYHEFNADVLEEIYGKMEENSSEGYFTLLIIDDFGADLRIKANDYILNLIFIKQRHLRTTVFLLCQNYYQATKRIREVVTNVIAFNTSKSQNAKMFREQFHLNDKQFQQLLTLMPTTHEYCILSLKYKRIFHNFNEVIFDM